jgi:cyclic pyranopterin phosphate synthase
VSRSKFCSAPFSTLIINADGKIGCCRELGTEHSVGNAFEESIEDIWNGEKIRKWRREFLSGEIKTCAREMNDMNCNLFKHNVEMLPHISMAEFVETPILRLSPDINGKCNLECPMCIVWKKPNGEYDKVKNFWADLESKIIPNLKIMDPLSGEPFIQDDFYKIMEISARDKWAVGSN